MSKNNNAEPMQPEVQAAGGTGKTSAEKCKAGKKNQKRSKKGRS